MSSYLYQNDLENRTKELLFIPFAKNMFLKQVQNQLENGTKSTHFTFLVPTISFLNQ